MPVPVVWKSKLISSPSPMQAVRRQGETVAVDLEAVAQPRLHDADVAVDLVDQPVDVGDEVLGDVADVAGDDGTEQQPAEAGRRIDGEHEVAEREPPRRRQRPRVPHLQLGQQHPGTVPAVLSFGTGPIGPRSNDRTGTSVRSHVLADERRAASGRRR